MYPPYTDHCSIISTPVVKLKTEQEKEEAIVERNLNYYKVTSRVSKKELDLRKKVPHLCADPLNLLWNFY